MGRALKSEALRKNVLVGLGMFLASLVVCLVVMLLLDLHYEDVQVLNYRGYRGDVVGEKAGNEIRIGMFGGSVMYGYLIDHTAALPAQVQHQLQAYCDSIKCGKKVTTLNLAYNNEGLYGVSFDLKDFSYLKYDYVFIYEGYNDLGVGNTSVYRHSNPLFRLTGYMPTLPRIAQERIKSLSPSGNGGAPGSVYRFDGDTGNILESMALEAGLATFNKADAVAERLKSMPSSEFDRRLLDSDPWAWYKYYMKMSIDYALSNHVKVIVGTQPYISDSHKQQQAELQDMLGQFYGGNPNVLYLDLGNVISLKDQTVAFDGMHLNPKGADFVGSTMARDIQDFVFNR